MLFLMIAILMIQLQSFQRLFLVVATGPLAVIGVAAVAWFRVQPAATGFKCDRANNLVDQQRGAATLAAAA
jgi:hypothetical protein